MMGGEVRIVTQNIARTGTESLIYPVEGSCERQNRFLRYEGEGGEQGHDLFRRAHYEACRMGL